MKLSDYLKKGNLSGLSFAEMHGLTQSTISRILNGKVVPSLGIALKIEKATKGAVTPKDLFCPNLEEKTPSSPQS